MKYLAHDGLVHLPHPTYDATVCGDALEGNPTGRGTYEEGSNPCRGVTPRAITCRICLAIARLCKSVPTKFLQATPAKNIEIWRA